MSAAARKELERAILNDEIENDTLFAEDFARRYELNPVSVRSAISRLRAELGKSRRRRRNLAVTEPTAVVRINAVTLLIGDVEQDPGLARIAAAALLRYDTDVAFRAAVDEQRPEIARAFESLATLQETTAELLDDEREDLARYLASGTNDG